LKNQILVANSSCGLTSRVSNGGSNFSISTVNTFCRGSLFNSAIFFAHLLNSGLSLIWKTIRASSGICFANPGCLRIYLENSKPIVRCSSQKLVLIIFNYSRWMNNIFMRKTVPCIIGVKENKILFYNSHKEIIHKIRTFIKGKTG